MAKNIIFNILRQIWWVICWPLSLLKMNVKNVNLNNIIAFIIYKNGEWYLVNGLFCLIFLKMILKNINFIGTLWNFDESHMYLVSIKLDKSSVPFPCYISRTPGIECYSSVDSYILIIHYDLKLNNLKQQLMQKTINSSFFLRFIWINIMKTESCETSN